MTGAPGGNRAAVEAEEEEAEEEENNDWSECASEVEEAVVAGGEGTVGCADACCSRAG